METRYTIASSRTSRSVITEEKLQTKLDLLLKTWTVFIVYSFFFRLIFSSTFAFYSRKLCVVVVIIIIIIIIIFGSTW